VDRSFLSRVAFPLFVWGLAFHSLALSMLLGLGGLPIGAVRALAAWKEAALATLVFVVVLRALTGRGPRVTLVWSDLWVGGLIAVAIAYFLGENALLQAGLPRAAQMLGIRDAVYFMLIYFVGRSTPDLAESDSAMRIIFALVLVTSVMGILERFLIPPEILVAIGVATYFQDFLGVASMTLGNDYGLPANYWTMIGGNQFRRSGSVYLSAQGFAVPFLLFFPLATAWVFSRPRRSLFQVGGYIVISVALLLTLTRMTIFIALLQTVLFVVMLRRPEWAVAGLALCGMMFTAALVLIPGFPSFVWSTLSWQEGSSVSHTTDWLNGVSAFAHNPWGMGLGTADQSALRSGLPHITGDNLYLKYAVEMGVLGISLLVLALGSIMGRSMVLYRNARNDSQRRMGAAMWLATIGVLLNGMTAVVFNSPPLGWLYFWLAGAVITSSQRVTAEQPVARPLQLEPIRI